MGALFNPPKAPAPPPPPPNPQTAAKPGESYSAGFGSQGGAGAAGGTLLTGPSGAQESRTGGKNLLGQ